MNTPIIKIEMEGLKAGVMHHMQQHNDDFNKMVKDALDNTLNEDWVKSQIQEAVNNTVENAISGLGKNWKLQNAVSEALGIALAEMVNRMHDRG